MKQHQRQLKKFSASTIEAINHLSPDELETHGIIQSARILKFPLSMRSSLFIPLSAVRHESRVSSHLSTLKN